MYASGGQSWPLSLWSELLWLSVQLMMTMGQPGAPTQQDAHEFNQLDGTNSHREWDNKYQPALQPILNYLYGWWSVATVCTDCSCSPGFSFYHVLHVLKSCVWLLLQEKKKSIPSFPYSYKADLWVGFCQPVMLIWKFNLKSANRHSKGDGRGSWGVWSMVLVKVSSMMQRCTLVLTASV